MQGKSLVESKEFWLQVITFILAILALPEFGRVVSVNVLPWIALLDAALTTAVRVFFTSQPIVSVFPK